MKMEKKVGRYSKSIKDSEPSSLRNTGVIPTNMDPWIIDQFQKMARGDWVIRELQKKADHDWVNERFSALKRETDDTKSTVREHKGKLSKAPKREEMNEVKSQVSGWSDWFRRIAIGVILFIVGTGGMALWQYSMLSAKVDTAYESIKAMSMVVKDIKVSQEQIERQFYFFQQLVKEEYGSKLEGKENIVDTDKR